MMAHHVKLYKAYGHNVSISILHKENFILILKLAICFFFLENQLNHCLSHLRATTL